MYLYLVSRCVHAVLSLPVAVSARDGTNGIGIGVTICNGITICNGVGNGIYNGIGICIVMCNYQ